MNNNIDAVLEALTPEIYDRLKRAIELRKWPNGQRLSEEQVNTCLEAVIAYESRHMPPEQRTGYMPPKTEPCADDSQEQPTETPLKWQ